jgi:AcrR family transcriptional regulator
VYTLALNTREQIFRAARRHFGRKGLDGLSMRAIAEDVGITPMAIYRHYADKEALLNALMLDGFDAWERRVGAITADDPIEWQEKLGEAFLAFALEEPRRYEAAFLLPASKARRYPDDFAAGRSPVVSMAYARLEDAKNKGLIGAASAADIVLSFAALAQGLVSLYRAGRFISEDAFKTAYRTAMRHHICSYLKEPTP